MFRSEAHFRMLTNLRFLELQKLLLKRFQIFKNEEITILKKDSMKTILNEWAEFLTKEQKGTNITHIPDEVLQNKKVADILRDDIECRWLVGRINVGNNQESPVGTNDVNSSCSAALARKGTALSKIDQLHFDEYPNLFHYEYPQFPYNYYDKKKMENFYSLLKFPYNDILKISKMIKRDVISPSGNAEEGEILQQGGKAQSEVLESTHVDVVNDDFMNYSSNSYVYAPSEMETSKENYHE
ncbi:conserved Plasmodium protein, unknown function [Plasmodium knowlesi strain H]|uniref:Uncharacterized protein n=3 Tax=Plasmodium knowlesi TaxID=5850 RepID=A0A5K1V4J9_PLAKH|nr:conserved protein, unknown function [Plasmodium knowlesi strain H]OTN66057.1 Uncharacterized protein PKNOH_S100057600 [Plasmodium knowlesi]CAA9987933.1 conserved protein, unknown function [Plasmodium knowlesi strain H]SBO22214.1 conserved Plasmodium protein, unknown function [Plasmodium knowlesi strain H]SBO28866.1 conserved Plasmodium protein, unknown function [Plasmodium knowlesi strain H]VVS77407.1 conserved protein, unknown function [Plasmodium knowlesi strain H]|eukprot:XP_002258914.1 hypothetical protein, conserved in Plasmodium species [Plasmodium knowlesi strain H]